MERRGSGLKKIIDYYEVCEKYSEDKKVIFESNPYDFRVVLPNLNYKSVNVSDNVTKNGTKNGTKNIEEYSDKNLSREERLIEILKILNEKPRITREQLSDSLLVAERTISRDIKKLQEDGRIERVGSRTKGYWKILK